MRPGRGLWEDAKGGLKATLRVCFSGVLRYMRRCMRMSAMMYEGCMRMSARMYEKIREFNSLPRL